AGDRFSPEKLHGLSGADVGYMHGRARLSFEADGFLDGVYLGFGGPHHGIYVLAVVINEIPGLLLVQGLVLGMDTRSGAHFFNLKKRCLERLRVNAESASAFCHEDLAE